jgi:hypothetical protein
MELTPEEKRKIYAEEKARLEAQEQLKAEKKKKDSKNAGIGCLVIIIIGIVIYAISSLSPSKSSSPEKESLKLTASVKYTGTQIVIINQDSYAWSNVKIELNSGLFDSGYYYEIATVRRGETVTIGILNFAKSGGERLNPLQIKVKSAYISAETPVGRAYCSGTWN